MAVKRKNMAIRLIRKQAQGFRVNEWLYLFEGYNSDHTGSSTLPGPFLITEIYHYDDSTVTFYAKPIRFVPFGKGYSVAGTVVATAPNGSYIACNFQDLDFPLEAELCRIAGEPLSYLIEENDFA